MGLCKFKWTRQFYLLFRWTCQFTCFTRPWTTHYNHSDCEPFPGISKDTQFNKHLWHLLCESGSVSGWCWAYGNP